MMQLTFGLHFLSDWHISAAYGNEEADSLIERDPYNVPYVRGATLKGLFREAFLDFSDFDVLKDLNPTATIKTMLGEPGIEGRWVFGNAHLLDVDGLHNPDRTHVVTGVRVDPFLRRAEEGKLYRREMGDRGSVFTFTITGNGDQADVEWLVVMARYVRRAGNRRRRGAGACEITLIEPAGLEAELLNSFEARLAGQTAPSVQLPQWNPHFAADQAADTRRFRVLLQTLSPTVMAGTPEAGNTYAGQRFISGRSLRGALGSMATDHEGDAFARLFYGGQAAFSDLLPLIPYNGGMLPVDELPAALMRDKATKKIYSILLPHESKPTAKKYRGLQALAVSSDSASDLATQLDLNTAVHVRIDNSTKRASGGDLFAYEAIPAGCYYIGEITVDDWASFSALLQVKLGEVKEIFLGKGRKRGYGHCRIWVEAIAADSVTPWAWSSLSKRLNLAQKHAGLYTLTLASDTIIIDAWLRAVQRFDEEWLERELGLEPNSIEIKGQQVETKAVDGFDVRSGLPTWRDLALKKGSSVSFKLISDEAVESLHTNAAQLEVDGIGLRRHEGYGRVIFNHPQHYRALDLYTDVVNISPAERQLFDFELLWRTYLQENVSKGLKGDIYRVLARLLMEKSPNTPQAVQQIFAQIETLDATSYKLNASYSQQRKSAKKTPRLSRKVLDSVEEALQFLYEQYPAYWRRGLLLLAQHINEQVKR